MSDIGRKEEGGKFYTLSAESQSFHNILNDFEELGIDNPRFGIWCDFTNGKWNWKTKI